MRGHAYPPPEKKSCTVNHTHMTHMFCVLLTDYDWGGHPILLHVSEEEWCWGGG